VERDLNWLNTTVIESLSRALHTDVCITINSVLWCILMHYF